MKIAYLMNTYPLTSTTFIRREIEALEMLGLTIHRHAVRMWTGRLVDPRDIAETGRTHYLLAGNIVQLLAALPRELFSNPRGLMRALRVLIELVSNARGGFVRHAAYLLEAAYFRQRAQSENIEHVHAHFGTNATTVALLSRVMGGPSYSFTAHGPDELVERDELSFSTKIRHAAFVVAITDYCRKELLEVAVAGDGGKIMVARCALALEEFSEPQEVDGGCRVLVCVGRLCPQKGQFLIPAAAAELRNAFPDMKIILAGDGESRAAVEAAIADHGVGDIVELKGWVANQDVLQLIRSSRALLLPSFAEGLPVVIMEALASGRPVISTTIAGIPELVDETCGWLFPAGDQRGLALAIRAALECPPAVLACMGEAGRARVTRLHDRRELAATLYDAFKRTVGAGRGSIPRRKSA